MLKEIIFVVMFIIMSFVAACVYSRIQNLDLPLYNSLLVSTGFALCGMIMLKHSSLSLLQQSSVIAVSTRFGYLCGLVYIGQTISLVQAVGMVIMVFGSFLTNIK